MVHQPTRARSTSIAALCALFAPTLLPGSAAATAPGTAAAASPAPNIVVVLVDDARLDDLSTMPLVRSLIGDAGATFSQSYTPFPVCAPDRATLLTGQYAHNHGVLGNGDPNGGFRAFDDSETIATWLDDAYVTGFTGKYINGYGLNRTSRYVPPGWDDWHGALQAEIYQSPRVNDNGRVNTYTGQYLTNVVADSAEKFIRRNADDPQPFFLFASFPAPHNGTPIEDDDPQVVYRTSQYPTPNVGTTYAHAYEDLPLDVGPAFNEADISDKPIQPPLLLPWEVDALTEVNQQRRESLLYVEDAVERITTTLEAAGELDNTYIVFTSDNGFTLGEHRLHGKSSPYQEAIHVPLMIRGPGIPAGTTVQQPVGAQDIAPTLLGMSGRTGAQGSFVLDGLDLFPLIADPSLQRDRPIVIEWGPTDTSGVYAYHGIRTGAWKYVERKTGKNELYDMVDDPYELDNRAGQAAWATVQAELNAMLDRYAACSGADCW